LHDADREDSPRPPIRRGLPAAAADQARPDPPAIVVQHDVLNDAGYQKELGVLPDELLAALDEKLRWILSL